MEIFQVCSDIHFERKDITEINFDDIIKVEKEILILAGDIGNPYSNIYEKFIEYCSNLFIHVLLIAGNHEYYDDNIDDTNNKIDKICSKYTNVHYINNKIFTYNNITFVGTTLWSLVDDTDHIYELKDYKQIKDFTPIKAKELCELNINFINEQLKNNKCIIISHHAPSYICIPDKFTNDFFNCCFASHLDYLFENKNLLGWIFGHTHYNISKEINGKFIYSNCYRTG
jgi:predicted phosphohydrolase